MMAGSFGAGGQHGNELAGFVNESLKSALFHDVGIHQELQPVKGLIGFTMRTENCMVLSYISSLFIEGILSGERSERNLIHSRFKIQNSKFLRFPETMRISDPTLVHIARAQ